MNDEHVIEKLRGAALGGPPATPVTAAAVAAGGRKLRRRRQALIGGTSALSVTALVLVLANLGGGRPLVEQVITPADPSGTGTQARQHNLELLRDALGAEDWRITDSKKGPIGVEPKAGSAPTRAVPAGDHIQADLTVGFVGGFGSSPDDAPTCGTTTDAGVTCSIVQSSDGKPVRVIHSSISYSPGAAFVATHLTFRRPDGSVSLLDVTVNSPTSSETQARLNQAMKWLKPLDDTLIAVATNPALQDETRYGANLAQPTPSPSASASAPGLLAAHNRNMERLKTTFGDGWKLQYGYKPQPVAGELTVVRGSNAGKGLPAGSSAEADIRAVQATSGDLRCPMGGDVGFTCDHHRTADGKDVLLVRYASAGDPEPSAETSAQYLRADRVLATLDVSVHTPPGTSSRGLDQARTWLKRLDATLAAAVTNPAMEIDQARPNYLPQPTPSAAAVPQCAASDLRLAFEIAVPDTETQRAMLVELRNISSTTCRVPALFDLGLYDARQAALPFSYHPLFDHLANGNPVPPMTLAPDGFGSFSVSKKPCARGDVSRAAYLSLTFTDGTVRETLALPEQPDLSWCGPGDPGSTITYQPLSAPVEATPAP